MVCWVCLCTCVTASWHTILTAYLLFSRMPNMSYPVFSVLAGGNQFFKFHFRKEPFSNNYFWLSNCSRATFVFVRSTVKENSVRYAEKESSRERASGESDGSNVCVFACWHTLPYAYLLTHSALCLIADTLCLMPACERAGGVRECCNNLRWDCWAALQTLHDKEVRGFTQPKSPISPNHSLLQAQKRNSR